MAKFIMIKFPPPVTYGQINSHATDTERACRELQSQLLWTLPKGTTISIHDDAIAPDNPFSVISSELAKG